MKKNFLLLVVFILTTMLSYSAPITRSEAKRKVTTFLEKKKDNLMYSNLKIKNTQISDVVLKKSTDAYYVFNIGKNSGFIIVSADDLTESILGYSNYGTFNPENIPTNMQSWLDSYEKTIYSIRQCKIPNLKSPDKDESTKIPYRRPIKPMITSRWNQDTPFNDRCPNFNDKHGNRYTGCVATAMAQVMYYHKWPKENTSTIPGYTYCDEASVGGDGSEKEVSELPSIKFQWDKMLDVYNSSALSENKSAVADLMYYCGASIKTAYYVLASGAFSVDIPHALRTYFNYDKGVRFIDREGCTAEEWDNIIYNELEEFRPVLYSGAAPAGGHQFVCDGYEDGYYHINWGWGGISDGYFKLDVLNPQVQLIGGAGDGMNFCDAQEIIIGIQPPVLGSKIPEGGPAISWMLLTKNTDGQLTKTKGGLLKMSINSRFAYNGEKTAKYKVGFGIYNKDNKLIKVVKEVSRTFEAGLNDVENELNTPITIGKDEIANDGIYFLKPVVSEIDSDVFTAAQNSNNVYFKLEVQGNKVFVKQYPDINVETEQIVLEGPRTTGVPLTLKANITNKGNAFDGIVQLVINGKLQNSISQHIALKKSETKEVSLNFRCPSTGNVEFAMVINGWFFTKGVIENMSYSDTDNSKLEFIPEDGFQSKSNTLDINTIIKNTSVEKPYNSGVKGILYKKSKNNFIIVAEAARDVNINALGSSTVKFHFDNLQLNSSYFLGFSYYNFGKEKIYGGTDNSGRPQKTFKGYSTANGLTYYDAYGNISYDFLENNKMINIPEDACFVEIPFITQDIVIKKNDNTNCIYSFYNMLHIPSEFKGCNILDPMKQGNFTDVINLDDKNDFYLKDKLNIKELNIILKIEDQLNAIWLPFEPDLVTCDGVEMHKAYDVNDLASGEKDFILLPCVAEDNNTIYFDFDSDYKNVPYILNVKKDFVGKYIKFTGRDIKNIDMKDNIFEGNYFSLCRSNTLKDQDENIYNFNMKDFSHGNTIVNPFHIYVVSCGQSNPEKVEISYPIDFISAGIEEVQIKDTCTNDETTNIYSLDGTFIRRVCSKVNILEGLPSGVYIVNGEKYIK